MPDHQHLHRRHARAAFPDPFALASAAADALASAFADPSPVANPQQTMVSIVYVTASKTFDGPVGGYTTLGPVVQPSTTPKAADPATTSPAKVHSSSTKVVQPVSSKIVADTTSKKVAESSTALVESLLPTSASDATSIPLLAATGGIATSHSSTGTAVISSETSTSSSTKAEAASSSSGGMSAGGKAGLAIGVLLLVGAALALALFFFKKRRNALKQEKLDDEKTDLFGSGPERAASTRTTATAPRLSLRPVTQFLPNLGDKRQSRGNALALVSTPSAQQSRQTTPWERPSNGQDAIRANPFGNHAEVIDATNANGPAVVDDVSPAGEIVAGSTAAVAGAAVGLARGTSKRVPNQMDFTKPTPKGPFMGPPSPAGTEFSMNSETPGTPTMTNGAAAIAAAGGPNNSTVHRVQLDFKPSMDDELELRAGQLIRLLHEYDDGWALCIRLDRSRQGVVPRTCLSTRPVKPRPQQNGPRGPPPPGMRVPNQPRPMSPAMNQGPPRSMSPAGNRPMTPNGQQGRPMTPQGRPMTPTGPQYNPQRAMTPNSQQNRSRSNSAAQMQDRRNSPPGPSPMNPASGSPPNGSQLARKPVGQAM